MKQAAAIWIGQTLATLECLELHERIEVRWNARFTSKMGSASYRHLEQRHTLQFSVPLWPRAEPGERRKTVIHETCHIVAYYEAFSVGKKIKPHGPEWQALMRRCGIEPERTHSVSNKGLSTRRRVEITCSCQTFSVTPYVAGRMAAGATYRCRRCKEDLKPPAGTKPVERRRRRRRRRG